MMSGHFYGNLRLSLAILKYIPGITLREFAFNYLIEFIEFSSNNRVYPIQKNFV